jgi:preprotein translocase subunit YajC
MPFDPNIIMFLLVGVVFFLFIIRPQMKEKKEFAKMLKNLKKGDKILTSSGMFGVVHTLKDEDTITVQVAEGVKIDFSKQAVSKVLA